MKLKAKPLSMTDLGQALFTEAGDVLFVYDTSSTGILEVNPATSRITGFQREELLNKTADFLLRFSDADGEQRLQKAAQSTALFVGQEGYLLRTKQEGWIPVNLTVSR